MKLKPIETYDERGLICRELHCRQNATWSGFCNRHDRDERPVKKRLFAKALSDTTEADRLFYKREAPASGPGRPTTRRGASGWGRGERL